MKYINIDEKAERYTVKRGLNRRTSKHVFMCLTMLVGLRKKENGSGQL